MEIATQNKKGKVNHFKLFFTGIAFLALAVLTFFFILRGIFGSFSIGEILPDWDFLSDVVKGGKPKVAILYSKYTQNMLPEGSTWLNDNVETWKKFLDNNKVIYKIIDDETIELGKHFEYEVLILPGSKSLSDKEISQIKKYMDKGGSVFATSGIASFSNDGKWRGWEFFSEVFGLKFTKEMENSELSKVHTLRGNLPITSGIPTGYPLKVATWDRPISVEVLDPRTIQTSFWYNYRLEDGLVREEVKKSAGIVYGTYGLGRFVWMGFEINSVVGVQEDYVYFEKMFRNCINWLTYTPIAYVKEWPLGYDAAAIITASVNDEGSNVSNLLPILREEGIPATFYFNPDKAGQYSNLIKSTSKYGEIGALIDIGYLETISDTINHLNSYEDQTQKFIDAKTKLEAIAGKTIYGVLPYYGLFDQNTIRALIDSKFKYVLTDSLTDRSVPKTIIRGEDRVISMTKTARDDYEVVRDFGLTQPEYQFYTYQEDIDRVLFEGGLYILKLHPEYQLKAENVKVVKDVIKDLKNKNYWITTAEEIQKWYQKKNYIELRVEKRGKLRIVITVSNPGKETMKNFTVQVEMQEEATELELKTEIIGVKPAKFQYDKETKTVHLFMDSLKPGESRTYYLDYKKPNA